jgi:hypothetical protein
MRIGGMKTNRFELTRSGDRMLFAPLTRPGDWRELPIGQIDSWLARNYRDLAEQPASVVPMSEAPSAAEVAR